VTISEICAEVAACGAVEWARCLADRAGLRRWA
jgi:hypothetical protein